MSVINTNVKSLVAQNAIEGNNNRLSTSMQRLSTGLRVNTAADDAAGLSIGTRMTAQVRGLSMAIKNANDGISLLNTAEGAMDEVSNMLQRMRELSVQAATDTVSASDRKALNNEVVALQKEINRVAETTQFNGFNVLDGSFKDKKLQIGDKAGVTMDVTLKNVEAASLGGDPLAKGTMISDRVDVAGLTGAMYINGTAINEVTTDNSAPAGATKDLADLVASINASNVGVTASAYNEVVSRFKGSGISAAGDIEITVNALDTDAATVITLGATTSMQDMVDQINAQGGPATVMARLNEEGKLVLYNNTGAKISTVDGTVGAEVDVDGYAVTATGLDTDASYNGFLKLTSNSGEPVKLEYATPADADTLGLNQVNADGTVVASAALDASTFSQGTWLSGSMTINGVDIWYQDLDITGGSFAAGTVNENDEFVKAINHFTDKTGVSAGLTADGKLTLKSVDNGPIQIRLSEAMRGSANLNLKEQNVGAVDFDQSNASLGYFAGGGTVASANILTQETATAAIKVMDSALEQVSSYRSEIGASVNRLNSTVSNLSNVVTNTQASRSRIMDTDYATETTNLARSQIIQQAATAMLAQANQSAQTVLSLLK